MIAVALLSFATIVALGHFIAACRRERARWH